MKTFRYVIAAVAAVALSFFVGRCDGRRGATCDPVVVVEHDTVVRVEHATDTMWRVEVRTVRVAVHDTTTIVRHAVDSVWVDLPFEFRQYHVEDTIDVYYSGVAPRIDSVRLQFHERTVIHERDVVSYRRPVLGAWVGGGCVYTGAPTYHAEIGGDLLILQRVGVGVSAGAMLSDGNVSPFVGASLRVVLK